MLKDTLELCAECKVPFNGIALCVLFRAMTSCLQTYSVPLQTLSRRKDNALQVAKHAFGDYKPVSHIDSNSLLSSICRLCDEIGSASALRWADEKWRLFENSGFGTNIVAYCTRLQLLEGHGKQQEVDQMLRKELVGQDLSPNVVVLGGLMNAAAKNRDWPRAKQLWAYLVQERHVEPQEPAFLAFAKAHLLSGKPIEAACIIEDMLSRGYGRDNYKVAVDYLQCLAIAAHSSPTRCNLANLTSALQANADLMSAADLRQVPKSARAWWRILSEVAESLNRDASQLRLKDVLVTSNARLHSVMQHWENFEAGSAYL